MKLLYFLHFWRLFFVLLQDNEVRLLQAPSYTYSKTQNISRDVASTVGFQSRILRRNGKDFSGSRYHFESHATKYFERPP